MLFIDAGSSYIKTLDTTSNEYSSINITDLCSSKLENVYYTTGHNSARFCNNSSKYINELVALSHGSQNIISKPDFLVLDIGSRDMKTVQFTNNKFDKCDWNTSCGAMIGFTIDLILKYFKINIDELNRPEYLDIDKSFNVTCGLLGITQFFDEISKTTEIKTAISSLIYGFAKFSWQFAGKPEMLYLSGGLTDNPVFFNHLKKLVPDLTSLGKFVLLDGLKYLSEKDI